VHGEQPIRLARVHFGLPQDLRSTVAASRLWVRPELCGVAIRRPISRDALWHPQSAPAARRDIDAIAERLNRSIRGRAGFDDATRRVLFKTFQAVEFETPALRPTSAIVATLLSQCMDFFS
jgi:hypothetical protein